MRYIFTPCPISMKLFLLLPGLPHLDGPKDPTPGEQVHTLTCLFHLMIFNNLPAYFNRPLRYTPCWKTKQYNLCPLGNEIFCNTSKVNY